MIKQQVYKQKGFTLIEMVVVIAVMGILMGFGFPRITTILANARDGSREGDLRTVEVQLAMYFNRCGHYPTNLLCGAEQSATAGTLPWSTLITRLEGTVVGSGEVPREPLAGRPLYQYAFGPHGLSYVIAADMERRGNNRDVLGTILGISCGTLEVPGTTFCIRN